MPQLCLICRTRTRNALRELGRAEGQLDQVGRSLSHLDGPDADDARAVHARAVGLAAELAAALDALGDCFAREQPAVSSDDS
ncbi:hypothetical protein [Rubrivirga litoralis]|uniref:Metal-sensitive transcriptional repressor n=1 Tax=Rubrivirga litoralis TaxID=3075598 RepID=A0ABU3BUV1_9BACT|nr:hypothetical protein [Rubrivirga sp. F394]MDT0632931.1 hypothetical protein [Rubrivirga sp. F394]